MITDSTLKKKAQSVAYHLLCDGAEIYERRAEYVNTHDNHTDISTKVPPMSEKR